MAITEYKRIINKTGSGVPTIPPSPSHDTGDWIETDIYDGEFYMDTDTGKVYTSNNGVIVQIDATAVPSASETVEGIAELATNLETQTGVDDLRIVTPKKLANWWTNLKASVNQFIASEWTFEDLKVQALGALFKTKIASGASSNQTWTIPAEGDQEFASRAYVDNLSAGLKWKTQVVAATTADGPIDSAYEDGDTLDGVLLATGDRILLKDQTAGAENGIYIVQSSGAPIRSTDADEDDELISAAVFVQMGTVNADKAFVCTNDTITLGVTSIVFTGFASVIGSLIAANNLSDVVSASTAFDNIKQTASETSSGVAEIATAAEVITGTDPIRMVVPARLTDWWSNIKTAAATITGIWTFTSEKVRIVVGGAAWYHALKSLATSNQTWSLPDEGDQTFASRAYADAKVADAINDGTTTVAPSQNAVYDITAAMLGIYRPQATGGVRLATGTVAGTYMAGLQQNSSVTSGVISTLPVQFINCSAITADMPTINGLNPKLRIRATIATNGTAPTGTYRWALFAVSGVGGAGAGVAYTIGAEEAGSTTPTISAPGASTTTNTVGSDFAVPASGLYCLALVKTGTIAVGAEIHSQIFLQAHYA